MRDARRSILVALMLSTALTAVDNTIVSTAVPSIVRDFGGFNQFPWLFSIYLLTQAITVPLYGRLADWFGRKPVLLFGIALFLTGSALCGLSWSMLSLIFFRGLQGIGAGAVLPIAVTIVGDLYDLEERGRIQGYLSGVWGIAAVIGPAFGGSLSQYASWRFIFYLNLPIGLAASMTITRRFHERVVRRRHKLDVGGAVLLVGGITLLVLGFLRGGTAWAWSSPIELGDLGCALALLGAATVVERRAAEPFLPPWVFSRRVLVAGNVAGFFTSALIIGLDSYVPTFAQGVVGVSPVLAGFSLAAESVTWILGSICAGRLYPKRGFRLAGQIGGAIGICGAASFLWLGTSSPLGLVAIGCAIMGLGFGFSATTSIVAVQSSVGWDRRGVVTGAAWFSRTVGGALGVSVFGLVANASLTRWLAHPPAALAGFIPHGTNAAARILGGSSGIHNSAASAFVRSGLDVAMHGVFICLVVLAALLLLPLSALPGGTPTAAEASARELHRPLQLEEER